MRLLFLGDIVGPPGVELVKKALPTLRQAESIDWQEQPMPSIHALMLLLDFCTSASYFKPGHMHNHITDCLADFC